MCWHPADTNYLVPEPLALQRPLKRTTRDRLTSPSGTISLVLDGVKRAGWRLKAVCCVATGASNDLLATFPRQQCSHDDDHLISRSCAKWEASLAASHLVMYNAVAASCSLEMSQQHASNLRGSRLGDHGSRC